jgi:hypothetical protein
VVAIPVALIAGLAAFWLLNGLQTPSRRPEPTPSAALQRTDPVTMAAPALGEPGATTCRLLMAKLPDRLRDRVRRPVVAGPEQNAAYGDPPITVSCGVPGTVVPPGEQPFTLSGVCWYGVVGQTNAVLTTQDRTVPIVVTIPRTYAEPGQWTIEFSGPIVATDPAITPPPSRC